jgi:hypothetical protein
MAVVIVARLFVCAARIEQPERPLLAETERLAVSLERQD